MSYLDAERVNGFPTTKRASKNKLMTENSITRLINRLMDIDGYVITNGLPETTDLSKDIPVEVWNNIGLDFEFNIHGYYFDITKSSSTASGLAYLMNTTNFIFSDKVEHTLYATIFIDKTDADYPELYGQDSFETENVPYQAIQFHKDDDTITYPSDYQAHPEYYEVYTTTLVKYKENEEGLWTRCVPVEALFRFTSASIQNIDGGEIILP